MNYAEFLSKKKRVFTGISGGNGATIHPRLYPWQASIVRWALRKGRAAVFADCGLGKTLMQVAWAQALDVRTLFLAPLCVADQTVAEAATIGVDIRYARNAVEAIGAKLVITNYERLEDFDLSEYQAVVLDESSILKSFSGKTRTRLIAQCKGVTYRLCCTATPSPNDIAELGNHAEFLGLMTWAEFLATWFVKIDQGLRTTEHHGWRLKGHAKQDFFRWVASWAVALRKPSDLGYPDDGFILPALSIRDCVVESGENLTGALFPEAGLKGIQGRLSARRGSLDARVKAVADLVAAEPDEPWLLWCGLNTESDALAKAILGSVVVSGDDDYEDKIAAVRAFTSGATKVLISKPRILGFGLNFQHCARMAFVGISDSYELYYQAVRRSWRFGQHRPVDAWIVVSDAETLIVENVRRKEAVAASLADGLIAHLRDFEREELAS